jgi:hypothetical protein
MTTLCEKDNWFAANLTLAKKTKNYENPEPKKFSPQSEGNSKEEMHFKERQPQGLFTQQPTMRKKLKPVQQTEIISKDRHTTA